MKGTAAFRSTEAGALSANAWRTCARRRLWPQNEARVANAAAVAKAGTGKLRRNRRGKKHLAWPQGVGRKPRACAKRSTVPALVGEQTCRKTSLPYTHYSHSLLISYISGAVASHNTGAAAQALLPKS